MLLPVNERATVNWSNTDGAAGAAAALTLAAAANVVHVIRKIVVSFSAAPGAVVVLTVVAGSTTIFKAVLPAAAGVAGQFDFECEKALTRNVVNEAVVVTVAAPGGAVVASLSVGYQ